MEALHPVPRGPYSFVVFSPSPPHIGQWTHPFCGTIPHPHPRSRDSLDPSVCEEDPSCCAWKLLPGTRLPGSSWEYSSAPHPPSRGASCQWRLDCPHSEVSFQLRPRCPGLSTHLDASLVFISLLPLPWCPGPTHSAAALLCHSEETRARGRGRGRAVLLALLRTAPRG